ncbi:MAG: methyltransferase domain-containing protein [Vicinamibacterales bacterium]
MSLSTRSPAEVYDDTFVPALFQHWSTVVADAARIGPGQRVLDVACGTGVLAAAAAGRVGRSGTVTGLDPSEEMLAVARRKPSSVDWRGGRAEALPFDDGAFDAVVSQFGFMFFENKPRALAEMMRVLKPGGRLALAVCDALDRSPGYSVLAELLHRLFGGEVAEAFRAPFSTGNRAALRGWCAEAGLDEVAVTRRDGVVRFPSIEALVSAERACAWTLGGLLSDEQFERLRLEAEESLQPFENEEGEVELLMPVLLLTSAKA